MEDKLILTYSLLAHIKEVNNNDHNSLDEVFIPIVKKGLSEYSKSKDIVEIKGSSLNEIQTKIYEVFGLEIPIPILKSIMHNIDRQINDSRIFKFYNDNSFIIKRYVFEDLEDLIKVEESNLKNLENDYKNYCNQVGLEFNFQELVDFILAQKVDLFTDKTSGYLNLNYNIPKYIQSKFNDINNFKTISDIYLGGILSSYLTLTINEKVTDTELLIDTNFLISLIDLNTEDSFNTCAHLYEICKRLGFRFTILFSTINEINFLLNRKIIDFKEKDFIGSIKTADIFNACIRRKLDKTDLERIKDKIPYILEEKGIVTIHEAQIADIIKKAHKSPTFIDLQRKRYSVESALNDAIAEEYVKQKRGSSIQEFSDVKCWFLHNSFNKYYYSQSKHLHSRLSISSSELLVLVWLTNPSQGSVDSGLMIKGALSSYIIKYRREKIPSREQLKLIQSRGARAIKSGGKVTEKDLYRMTVRMSEGQFDNSDIEALTSEDVTEFEYKLVEIRKEDEKIRLQNDNILIEKDKRIKELSGQIEKLHSEQQNIINEKITSLQDQLLDSEVEKLTEKKNSVTYRKSLGFVVIYFVIVSIIIALVFISHYYVDVPRWVTLTLAIVALITPFISLLINQKWTKNKFYYLFSKTYRKKMKDKWAEEYRNNNRAN